MYIHSHLASIRFRDSGDLVGRNANCILGWYFTNVSFTLFDLCIDTLSSLQEIFALYYCHIFGLPSL